MQHILLLSFVSAAMFSLTVMAANPQGLNGANLTEVISGFNWAENMVFDNDDNFWITDDFGGALYRLRRGDANRTFWVGGFKNALGLAFNAASPQCLLMAVCITSGNCSILNVSTAVPNVYTILTETQGVPNGLVWDARGATVVWTTEGDFVPGEGVIYTYSMGTCSVAVLEKGLNAADGLFLDNATGLLYASEVVAGNVLVFNSTRSNLQPVKKFKAPNMTMLDDFCIVRDISSLYGPGYGAFVGADWWAGNVVAFGIDTPSGLTPGTVWATGLTAPTSVRRPPKGSAWDTGNNVFVSEGKTAGLFGGGRVWELSLP